MVTLDVLSYAHTLTNIYMLFVLVYKMEEGDTYGTTHTHKHTLNHTTWWTHTYIHTHKQSYNKILGKREKCKTSYFGRLESHHFFSMSG